MNSKAFLPLLREIASGMPICLKYINIIKLQVIIKLAYRGVYYPLRTFSPATEE
jgi:hypothetical protein